MVLSSVSVPSGLLNVHKHGDDGFGCFVACYVYSDVSAAFQIKNPFPESFESQMFVVNDVLGVRRDSNRVVVTVVTLTKCHGAIR